MNTQPSNQTAVAPEAIKKLDAMIEFMLEDVARMAPPHGRLGTRTVDAILDALRRERRRLHIRPGHVFADDLARAATVARELGGGAASAARELGDPGKDGCPDEAAAVATLIEDLGAFLLEKPRRGTDPLPPGSPERDGDPERAEILSEIAEQRSERWHLASKRLRLATDALALEDAGGICATMDGDRIVIKAASSSSEDALRRLSLFRVGPVARVSWDSLAAALVLDMTTEEEHERREIVEELAELRAVNQAADAGYKRMYEKACDTLAEIDRVRDVLKAAVVALEDIARAAGLPAWSDGKQARAALVERVGALRRDRVPLAELQREAADVNERGGVIAYLVGALERIRRPTMCAEAIGIADRALDHIRLWNAGEWKPGPQSDPADWKASDASSRGQAWLRAHPPTAAAPVSLTELQREREAARAQAADSEPPAGLDRDEPPPSKVTRCWPAGSTHPAHRRMTWEQFVDREIEIAESVFRDEKGERKRAVLAGLEYLRYIRTAGLTHAAPGSNSNRKDKTMSNDQNTYASFKDLAAAVEDGPGNVAIGECMIPQEDGRFMSVIAIRVGDVVLRILGRDNIAPTEEDARARSQAAFTATVSGVPDGTGQVLLRAPVGAVVGFEAAREAAAKQATRFTVAQQMLELAAACAKRGDEVRARSAIEAWKLLGM